jgi:hypothetical protein
MMKEITARQLATDSSIQDSWISTSHRILTFFPLERGRRRWRESYEKLRNLGIERDVESCLYEIESLVKREWFNFIETTSTSSWKSLLPSSSFLPEGRKKKWDVKEERFQGWAEAQRI